MVRRDLTIGRLWTAAWVLGLVAIASVVLLITHAPGGTHVQAELLVRVRHVLSRRRPPTDAGGPR
jgi:hypothetical protein